MTRIECIRVTGPSSISVSFEDGTGDRIELAGWIAIGGDVLAPLRDTSVFKTARIGANGECVRWGENDDLAIDASHLRGIAELQRWVHPSDLISWQAENGFSDVEAARIVGMHRSAWVLYRQGKADIPMPVQIVFRSLMRDPVLIHARHRPEKRKTDVRSEQAGSPS
jgi:hypothetical protein